MSDFFYIDANTKSYVEKTSQANISKGLYNNYQIGRSCIFNNNQYFTRTPSVSGNLKSWTFSCWIKKTINQSAQQIITGWDGASTSTVLQFTIDDALDLYNFAGAYYGRLITTRVFRDPSSWYHIVAVWDSNNSISSERQRLYVNGERIRSFSTESYTAETSYGINRASYVQYLSHTSRFYMTEINFIDNQSLDAHSFGYFDNQRDFVWKPKKYTGLYGINGYYINFGDNTSSSTIGRDFSGNGNNFSINGGMDTSNIFVDSPTNNYPTYNLLSKNSAITLSNNNIVLVSTNNRAQGTTFAIPRTGKWYAEFTPLDSVGVGGTFAVGVIGVDTNFIGGSISMITTTSGIQTIAYIDNANRNVNGTIGSSGGATYGLNDVIGVAVDADNGSVSFYKGNSLQFTVSGSSYTTYSGNWMFGAEASANSKKVQFNAGQRSFTYTPPSGFRALCTTNLPTPVIKKPSSYMDVVTYTGTGATQTISGLGFSPDLLWTKGRNLAQSHNIFDTQRSGKRLRSDQMFPEASTTVTLGANGFTLGAESESNNNGSTFVAWCWDAGSSTVSNTQGSITSQVRANISAGFSIVTATCAGGTNSYGHGLGVKPAMYIVKNLSNSQNWQIWHQGLSNETIAYLQFNVFGEQTYATMWAASTSTTFSLVGDGPVVVGNNFVAYVFAPVAGYSFFGSYTGNGSADGPFVYCGFRPKLIIGKRVDAMENWIIYDTSRDSFNVASAQLQPNGSIAEFTGNALIDFNSNGFKFRSTNSFNGNSAGGKHIFAAFAETPLKYALAR